MQHVAGAQFYGDSLNENHKIWMMVNFSVPLSQFSPGKFLSDALEIWRSFLMSADSFRDFVLEQLAALDGLRCKRMFGGYGLYCGEQFFGIVFDGRLYFKTNTDTLPEYLAFNAAVFAPSEKQVLKNYREVPIDILEDSESLLLWARKAARRWAPKL